jgi:hypothetical protein
MAITPSSALLHALSPQRVDAVRPAPRAAAPAAPPAPVPNEPSASPAVESSQRTQRRGSLVNILA